MNQTPASLILFYFVCKISVQIEIQRLQQIIRFVFFCHFEELAFQCCYRACPVLVAGEVLFILSAFGVGRLLLEVAPDVGYSVFGVTGMWLCGEGRVDQAVEFLNWIGFFVFQQRADGLIDRGRPLEDGVFIAAPLFL